MLFLSLVQIYIGLIQCIFTGSWPSGNFYKLTSELKVSNILKMGSGLIPKKSRILISMRLQKFQTLFSLPVAFQSMKHSLFIACLPGFWLLVHSPCTPFSNPQSYSQIMEDHYNTLEGPEYLEGSSSPVNKIQLLVYYTTNSVKDS